MKTFEIDATGDLVFDTQNSLIMVEYNDEIEQSFRLLLGTNQGEWFLNLNFGLDFYNSIFLKTADEEIIRFALIECLSQEQRFEELLEFEITKDRQARTAIINIKVKIKDMQEPLELEVEV